MPDIRIDPFPSPEDLAALWAAAILTLYTGYDYFKAGIDHLTGPVPDAAPPPAAAKRDGAS